MLKWRTAALTDVGCQRQKNEDSFFVSPDDRVFVVADGMGGALGGAKASYIAVNTIETSFKNSPPQTSSVESIKKWIQETITEANKSIFHQSETDASYKGMGTTVVVAVQSDDDTLIIGHVGDSRAYLFRDKKHKLLTNDHSVVQEMVRAGRLTEEQARINPYKNLITRCLGHDEKVEIDHTPVALQPNDSIVICSDGLPTVLLDEQICRIVSNQSDPTKVAHDLVDETRAGGAPDNVTVVVIKYLDANTSSENGKK